jgi:hypothetical protein
MSAEMPSGMSKDALALQFQRPVILEGASMPGQGSTGNSSKQSERRAMLGRQERDALWDLWLGGVTGERNSMCAW